MFNKKLKLYERIFDDLADGICVIGTDRKVLLWNRAAERITGSPASEVSGRQCYDCPLKCADEKGNTLCDSGCPLLGLSDSIRRLDNVERALRGLPSDNVGAGGGGSARSPSGSPRGT